MTCYLCGAPTTTRCPQCRRPFCSLHGDRLCQQCRLPVSLLPSTAVYRGAVLLFVLALALGGWHLAAWPDFPSPEYTGSLGQVAIATMAQDTTVGTGTPASSNSGTATAEAGAGAATPQGAPGSSPGPSPTATASGRRTHTVQAGDTMVDIALRYNVTVDAIVAANGISDPTLLRLDQELVIP